MTKIYVTYVCGVSKINFLGAEIDRANWAYVLVILDLVGMFVILIFVLIAPFSFQNEEKKYRANNVLVSDYTVHVSHVGIDGSKVSEELNDFLKFLNNVINSESQKPKDFTVDSQLFYEINYPILTDYKLDLLIERNDLIFRKIRMEQENLIELDEAKKIKKETQLEKIESKLSEVKAKLNEQMEVKEIKDIFLTCKDQQTSAILHRAFERNKCNRCCLIFCCKGSKIRHK